eukprot:COSAG06_NODE_4449_length_4252_cov_21.903443_3_plen_78_part_00
MLKTLVLPRQARDKQMRCCALNIAFIYIISFISFVYYIRYSKLDSFHFLRPCIAIRWLVVACDVCVCVCAYVICIHV